MTATYSAAGTTGLLKRLHTRYDAVPVAGRYSFPAGTSNGTDTSATYVVQHFNPGSGVISDVQLLYGNMAGKLASDSPTNAYTLKAAIEYPKGVFLPVSFRGQRTVSIDPHGHALSDPLPLVIPAGAVFWTRQYVSVSAGQTWPVGGPAAVVTYEGNTRVSAGGGGQDWTLGGGTVPHINEFSFAPMAILGNRGTTLVAQPIIGCLGDSIGAGQGDSDSDSITGYVGRAVAPTLGLLNSSIGGDSLTNWALLAASPNMTLLDRLLLLDPCTHVVVSLGTNDFGGGSVSAMQTNAVALYTVLANLGKKVYGITIPPHTTSTDSWTTTGGQTVTAAETTRATFNDWIRTSLAPLTGYFETADTVETARNSGIWKATGLAFGYTADGVHPSAGGHAAMATAISPSAFS